MKMNTLKSLIHESDIHTDNGTHRYIRDGTEVLSIVPCVNFRMKTLFGILTDGVSNHYLVNFVIHHDLGPLNDSIRSELREVFEEATAEHLGLHLIAFSTNGMHITQYRDDLCFTVNRVAVFRVSNSGPLEDSNDQHHYVHHRGRDYHVTSIIPCDRDQRDSLRGLYQSILINAAPLFRKNEQVVFAER